VVVAFCRSHACVAPKPGVVSPTQADRLIQAYPEIQNGRLLILADFEEDKQMGIFQLESATNPGRLARDPKKGRAETGAGALAVALTAPNESVVISSPQQGEWFLKRDWRPYDLFMMAVNSPAAGLNLEIKIVGGVSGSAVEARTETFLAAGWNLLRFDLAEVGEQVPLDDIQEIRLAVMNPPVPPSTLYFDDFLLAGNRRDLMGDSANQSGSLYVQNAGRHWNIGAGGRFEISFRNGQIIRWFNLSADPYRLRNLVRGASLGPMPVLIEESKTLRPSSSLGDAVAARQRILEMNEVRVVVECLLQADSKANAAGRAAFDHWMYTIYATGQIFVSATTSALREEGPQEAGMAVSMAWSPRLPRSTITRRPECGQHLPCRPKCIYAAFDSILRRRFRQNHRIGGRCGTHDVTDLVEAPFLRSDAAVSMPVGPGQRHGRGRGFGTGNRLHKTRLGSDRNWASANRGDASQRRLRSGIGMFSHGDRWQSRPDCR
jgi:hypothetical protein